MTQDNSSHDSAAGQAGSGTLFNTAAGWVLFAAGLGLGLSIVSGKVFHGDKPQRPEKLGYVIEGAVEEGAGAEAAEMSMAQALNQAPQAELIAAGEKVFAKCQSCHTIAAGGANGIGPNLYGTMGKALGGNPGFAYSAELKAKGGNWDWESMNAWLKNPKAYIAGTKMGFAGLTKVEDRAAVAMYLNAQGSNLPVPTFVADAAAAGAPAGDASLAPAEGETPAASETPAQ
jgi:cytochrome c